MKLKTFKVQFKSSFSEMYSSHLREIILFVVFFRCVCDELEEKEGRTVQLLHQRPVYEPCAAGHRVLPVLTPGA